ncbi:P-loop containing nucleoside triphosphate hydrolase protein [Dactylonectria macrodidyma]|uniref:ATP-dependent DNA helicase n=1 Tax=Dactylonectria macrodidyma TaxID=307937 RepID=A0A9P9FTB3_9HYPO|nr:P-loop containing nucleoside triphosphate hydrolase protein [Dactylonectria macrodidyma]
MIEDEFDSGDDLFEGVDEAEILVTSGTKRGKGYDDDETRLTANKKARHSPDVSPSGTAGDESRLRLAQNILVEKFGYPAFRHEQEGAINRVLGGQNSLVIFPTGAGKSLCYQIPAIAFEEIDRQSNQRNPGDYGITIVVSPLIALMKDQVDALKKKGIAAECMDSTRTWPEIQQINESLRQGELRLLYCAPERLNNEGFVGMMKHVKGGVRLIGVDEAHCISEWGHSFRPDYLKVARFVQEIKAERVICLTATATPVVAKDICKAFNIAEEGVFRTSPYRPNLQLEVKATKEKKEKDGLLVSFLKTNPGSTLVYVTLQKQAEEVAADLNKKGFGAHFFHAGMKVEEKKRIQDDFMASRIRIVVATIAFGMGIDKSDIRNIVHWDFPNTVEEYCQQVGRAGRDGKPSRCMLYLCPEDSYIKESFARGDLPSRLSLKALLKDIFKDEVIGLGPGDTFKTSHHSQASEFDMRQNTLGTIYAALELRFNLIRAITPEYSSYKFEATPSYFPRLKNDKAPEAKAILDNAVKAKKLHSIDLSAVAKKTGLRRPEMVQLLNRLNETGVIKLTVSGVEQKYKVLAKLPASSAEINSLTDKLLETLETREEQALDRVKQVVNFVTAPKCFARSIAEHFGMSLPDGKDKCGHCTFCISGKPVQLPASPPKPINKDAISQILKTTDVRDDPRFLARVAFGIKSPRVTKLKLDKKSVFMSMADQDFSLILKEFEKACGKAT